MDHIPFLRVIRIPLKLILMPFDVEAIIVSGNGSQVGHINYYYGKFNAYQRTYVISDFKPVNIIPIHGDEKQLSKLMDEYSTM